MSSSATLRAINDMVVGLKADGVWDKITEAYLLCAHTFPAITVKLKAIPARGLMYASDFSAGLDGWAVSSGGSGAGNIDSIGGLDDCLRLTSDGSASSSLVRNVTPGSLIAGKSTCSIQYYIPSTNTGTVSKVSLNQFTENLKEDLTPAEDTWHTITGTTAGNMTGVQARIFVYGLTNTDVIYYRTYSITEIEPLTLTNNNFVSGDLVTAGSGAGLKGTATSGKWLNTNVSASATPATNLSYGTYNQTVLTNGEWMGVQGSGAGVGRVLMNWLSPNAMYLNIGENDGYSDSGAGFYIASSTGTSGKAYKNGANVRTFTSAAISGTGNWSVMRGPNQYTSSRLTFAFIGTNVDATDAANLSSRVNALMTALGSNVY